ncbi:hypothetical protein ACB092_03G054400 [Castanea dentata]
MISLASLAIPNLKHVWDTWNVRVVILVSLTLQIILIVVAPFRKRTTNKAVIMSIWVSYLLADWAASFAVGHISITAFALEDNELWLRHLFSFGVQLAVTLYVFWLTFPKNKLLIPTLLMFAAGIIKYFERTRALFLASLGRFRKSLLKDPDPGPNYAKLMEEYSSKKEAGLPTKIEMTREPGKESKLAANVRQPGKLSEIEVVTYAYHYFQKFKGLIVDIIFSYRERNESRDFFLNRNAEDALKLIELELNFIYEAFYTKVLVVHSKTGYIFRLISIVLVFVSSYNLIAYCLEQRPPADRGRFRRFMDKMDYFGVWDNVTDFFFPKTYLYPTKKLPKNLWSFIFGELKEKSKDAEDDEEIT